MRRKDRELSFQEGLDIIDKSQFAVISCIDKDEIFSIPMSIVRDDMSIFLHGATTGSKKRLFSDGKALEVVCVIDVKVPEFSQKEIENAVKGGKASNIFTTEYKSAIIKTKAFNITDDELKINALKMLSQKYTPNYMHAFDTAIKQSLKHTEIYELKIISLSAKAKIINRG